MMGLAACSSMQSIIGDISQTDKVSQDTNDEVLNEKKVADLTDKPEQGSVSPAFLIAQSLIAQSDLYLSSKQILSRDTKAKVVDVLHEFNKHNFEQSEKLMTQILATEPALNSAVFVLAGDISLANKKQLDAIAHYRDALKLNEYNAKAANRLATQLRQQGDFEKAEKLYTRAIVAQASHAESYRNRAVLYDLYINEKAKALQDYQTYSALLNYRLSEHENASTTDLSLTNNSDTQTTQLNKIELKSLKTNIKLVKRWLADVGRQVASLAKVDNDNASGN